MEKYFPPVISQKIFIDAQYTLNYDAWLSCCCSAPPPTWPWSPTCWCWSCWWSTTTWTLEWPRGGKNGSSTTTWWRRDGPHGALQWRVQGNAWRFLVTILANILIFQPRPQWNSILQISDARDINSEPLQKKLLQESPRKSLRNFSLNCLKIFRQWSQRKYPEASSILWTTTPDCPAGLHHIILPIYTGCRLKMLRPKIPRKRMLRTMTHFPSYLFSLPSTPTRYSPTSPALYHRLRGYQDHWCQDRGTSPSTKSSARYARRSLLSSSCRGLLTQALGCDCDCGCWETGIWELFMWTLLSLDPSLPWQPLQWTPLFYQLL